MKSLQFACMVGFVLLSLNTTHCQSITGSTTATIDSSTGVLTATCETDLDGDSANYYNPQATCYLYDGGMNRLVAQSYQAVGALSAAVTLTWNTTAGNIYFARGHHIGVATLGPDYVAAPSQRQYYDYYNFGFSEISSPMWNDFWLFTGFAPGAVPPKRSTASIVIADTTATAEVPLPNATLSLRTSGQVSTLDSKQYDYAAVLGDQNLGSHSGTFPNGHQGCLQGYELVGQLNPPTSTSAVIIKRYLIAAACYGGPQGQTASKCSTPTLPTDDTGSYVTTTPATNGAVYNLDAPGVIDFGSNSALTSRVRFRFRSFAELTGTKQVISSSLLFNAAVSCRWSGSSFSPAMDVPNDNRISTGSIASTWDLK